MGPDPARTAVQLGLYRGDGIGDLAGDGAVHRVLRENGLYLSGDGPGPVADREERHAEE